MMQPWLAQIRMAVLQSLAPKPSPPTACEPTQEGWTTTCMWERRY